MKADLNLPSPRVTLLASCLLVGGTWLVLQLLLQDPWTILFLVIALGSDILVRYVTSGLFADMYWPVVIAVQVFFSVVFFAGPGLAISWLGGGRLPPARISLLIVAWLIFYIASLAFLFSPNMFI